MYCALSSRSALQASERISMQSQNTNLYRKIPAWLVPSECDALESMSHDVQWEQGRQGTGYLKHGLIHEPAAQLWIQRALHVLGDPEEFDAWLLYYPTGSEIPAHTDPAREGMCHVRLNAIVTGCIGGDLYLGNKKLALSQTDAYIFRPDITLHSVTPIQAGSRIVLSVGASVSTTEAQALGLA